MSPLFIEEIMLMLLLGDILKIIDIGDLLKIIVVGDEIGYMLLLLRLLKYYCIFFIGD